MFGKSPRFRRYEPFLLRATVMPARARREIVDASSMGFYHCFSRCVRRAFLCGEDSYTGKNYDHRKCWVERRVQLLASCMAVDIIAMAVLDNH